jgi:hypothetical protein
MIQIVLREIEGKDLILNNRDSKDYVKGFWLFNHGECCGLIDIETMEDYFMQMHGEYDKDATTIDDVEFIDSSLFGVFK